MTLIHGSARSSKELLTKDDKGNDQAFPLISSVLYGKGRLIPVYARPATDGMKESLELILGQIEAKGLTQELFQSLVTYEQFLNELSGKLKHIKDEDQKQEARSRRNAARKCLMNNGKKGAFNE